MPRAVRAYYARAQEKWQCLQTRADRSCRFRLILERSRRDISVLAARNTPPRIIIPARYRPNPVKTGPQKPHESRGALESRVPRANRKNSDKQRGTARGERQILRRPPGQIFTACTCVYICARSVNIQRLFKVRLYLAARGY